jgi:hypothetical protein
MSGLSFFRESIVCFWILTLSGRVSQNCEHRITSGLDESDDLFTISLCQPYQRPIRVFQPPGGDSPHPFSIHSHFVASIGKPVFCFWSRTFKMTRQPSWICCRCWYGTFSFLCALWPDDPESWPDHSCMCPIERKLWPIWDWTLVSWTYRGVSSLGTAAIHT